MGIPLIIWTYWPDVQIPEEVTQCIKTWKHHNPKHIIIVLDDKNLHGYVSTYVLDNRHANLSSAYKSLFIQIHVLAKYGGTWLYPLTICKQPLTRVSPKTFWSFFLFTESRKMAVIDYHCMSCTNDNPFILALADELLIRSLQFPNVTCYVVDILQKIPYQPISLKMSASLLVKCSVLNLLYNFPHLLDTIVLSPAEADPWKRTYMLNKELNEEEILTESIEILMNYNLSSSLLFLKPDEFLTICSAGLLDNIVYIQNSK